MASNFQLILAAKIYANKTIGFFSRAYDAFFLFRGDFLWRFFSRDPLDDEFVISAWFLKGNSKFSKIKDPNSLDFE